MTPILTNLEPRQSSLHRGAFSKHKRSGAKDTCVTWDNLNIRVADSSQIILSTAVEITCHDNDNFAFAIWLSQSPTKCRWTCHNFLKHSTASTLTCFYKSSDKF